jgi:hypothetical protein
MSSRHLDLKRLERTAWRSFHQDGLWDVFLGLVLLAVGISSLVGSDWLNLMLTLAALGVMASGKHFVTVPRMGAVRFGPERRAKNRKVAALLFLTVLLGVALYAAAVTNLEVLGWQANRGVLTTLAMSLVLLVIFGGIAYWLDFPRMLLLGFAFAAAFATSRLLHTPVTFLVAGGTVLFWGVALFARFVRKHPLPAEGGRHGRD